MRPWVAIVASVFLAAADARALDCPPSVPDAGAACDAAASCEYGGDTHGLCATFASCTSGAWHVYAPDAGCGAPRVDCPASFYALDAGAACPLSDPNALCVYAEGACSCPKPCRAADGGFGSEWICRRWSSSWPGCPSARPALGTACDQDGALCAWDGCCWDVPFGPDEECTNEQWTLHPLNACACGGTLEGCPSPPIALGPRDGGAEDAARGDDESPPLLASGCSCDFGSSSGAPAGFVLAVAAFLAARRRRRE